MAESNADLIADYLGEAKDYLEKLNEKLMLLEFRRRHPVLEQHQLLVEGALCLLWVRSHQTADAPA